MNLDSVVERITPSEEEHEEEQRIVEEVSKLLSEHDVAPVLVGSLAKGTDLRGNKDIDLFIQFPQDVDRETLEKRGLKIGKDVFRKLGVEYEIDYAEHPYVKGSYKGHDIEVVPCYCGKEILSSVDRTPFHNEYVKARLAEKPLNGDIRLLKQFMQGIDVYGAEARVEGFSGYLVELLVIHYGSFHAALEAAVDWTIPEVIDPEGLWEDPAALPKFFTDANLIVVDPVDRSRNVAAAVSPECLSKFIVKASEFIDGPSEDFFFPPEKPMRPMEELRSAAEERGTRFYALVFRHGKLNANTLYAQLRKTSRHVKTELEAEEFRVFRESFWTNEADISVVLLELEVWMLPELVHHLGPPVDQAPEHQERFTKKYAGDKPYVKDGRWVVDTARKYCDAGDFLSALASEKRGFGKNLREMKDPGLVEGDIFGVDGEPWLKYLNEYLD